MACGGCSGGCSGCNDSGSCSSWKDKVDNNTCSGCGTSCSKDCGNCGSNCGDGCDGCSNSCDTGCVSCGGCDKTPCETGCKNTCEGQCSGCGGSCSRNCTGDCDGDCDGTCSRVCANSCSTSCKNTCEGTCTDNCTGCTGGCKSCANACTSTEMVTVINTLASNLKKDNYIKASDFLEIKNAFTRGFSWRQTSYKDVAFPTPVQKDSQILSSQAKALFKAMQNYNGIDQSAEAAIGAIVESKDYDTMIAVVKQLIGG